MSGADEDQQQKEEGCKCTTYEENFFRVCPLFSSLFSTVCTRDCDCGFVCVAGCVPQLLPPKGEPRGWEVQRSVDLHSLSAPQARNVCAVVPRQEED